MLEASDAAHAIRVAHRAPEGPIKKGVVDAFYLPKEWVHVGSIAGAVALFKLQSLALTPA